MKAEAVVEKIEVMLGFSAPPAPLKATIYDVLVGHFALPAIQAAERSEKLLVSVGRVIAARALEHELAGTLPTLILVGTTEDIVCGSCHVFPHDSPNIATAKTNRPYVDDLLGAMRGLSFQEFEKFGAAVLRELGVKQPKITSHGNDQGIDFYGHFSMGQLEQAPAPFFKLAHDVTFAFAGQAKHYPTRSVGPDVVRELVGAISLARTKTYSSETIDLFEEVEVKPFTPLLALLFTTGELTSGAVQLAASAGLIARSGRQLALYLADRGVGIEDDGTTKKFDKDKFLSWVLN